MSMRREVPFAAAVLVAALGALVAQGADWPFFRGPHGTGISDEKLDLHPAAPRRLWQVSVPGGRGSVTVVKGKAYVAGVRDQKLAVTCLDAGTGAEAWTVSDRNDGGNNSTPAVTDGRLYLLGYRGRAYCLDAGTGSILWQRLLPLAGDPKPSWGHAGMPVVWEGLVICNVGTGVALRKETGEVAWQHSGQGGYATPVLFRHGNRVGVAVFAGDGLYARDVRTGELLWKIPWETERAVNACDPVFTDGHVLVSTTYGKGAALFDLRGREPRQVWFRPELGSSYCTSVLVDGNAYGVAGNRPVCHDVMTGATRWMGKANEAGFMLFADGWLIHITQSGLLSVAHASPAGFTPLASARVVTGKTWGPPALSDGKVYVRTESGELACWRIAR